MVSGVRVLADGSDDEFFDVHDEAENDVASVRPNDFLGSLKRRPESLRPHRVLPSEQDEPVERGHAGKRESRLGLVQRSDIFDTTSAEVYSRFIYRPPSVREAYREVEEAVVQFMRVGNWQGIHSYMTTGHPELYDDSQGSDRWYIDAQGYVRVWKRLDARSRRDHSRPSMSAANLEIVDQVQAMVSKGLDKIPAPIRTFVWKKGKREEIFPAQRLAMEKVYAILRRELVEPLSRADRQARLEAAVRDNPDKSLRELARQEGSSRSTIQRIRKRLDEGVPL